MPSLTEPKRLDDVVIWEAESLSRFTRAQLTFRHAVGSTQSFEPGLVCETISTKQQPLATAANANSILLQRVTNLATATDLLNVLFLVNGPCIVKYDNLNFNGQVAATAWAALRVLLFREQVEPTQSTELTA